MKLFKPLTASDFKTLQTKLNDLIKEMEWLSYCLSNLDGMKKYFEQSFKKPNDNSITTEFYVSKEDEGEYYARYMKAFIKALALSDQLKASSLHISYDGTHSMEFSVKKDQKDNLITILRQELTKPNLIYDAMRMKLQQQQILIQEMRTAQASEEKVEGISSKATTSSP